MANYNSLEDLFAGVSNATKVIDDDYNDDYDLGPYNLTTPLQIDGHNVYYVYVNANSYINFYDEYDYYNVVVYVNNQDGCLYNLWTEEGTVAGYNFFRIRFDGYTHYSENSSSYHMTYDMCLMNGRVYLNMVNMPTSNYSGDTCIYLESTYSSYGYITLNPSSSVRTWTWYDDNGWTYKEGLDSFGPVVPPYLYLIRDMADSYVYTYSGNLKTRVTADIGLASTFETYGMTELPPKSVLPTEFSLLRWSDEESVSGDVVVVADKVASGNDNCILFHLQPENVSTIDSVTVHADCTIYYSNDGTNWSTNYVSILDASDFYMKADLSTGTYFKDVVMFFE